MATAAVLSLLDEHTRQAAFDASLAKLKAAPHGIDINALDICLGLLPNYGTDGEPGSALQYEQLWDVVLSRLVGESSPDHLYGIAELCLKHESPVRAHFKNRLYSAISQAKQDVSSGNLEALDSAKTYLHFLKCCFWVPEAQDHMVDAETLSFLSNFLGINGLDDVAHETLSAFFSLLKNTRRGTSSLQINQTVNESLWTQLSTLDVKRFAARSSNIYRTWFQWISLAASSGLVFQCVHDEQYWKKLRLGLVKGHADQRKYCLGIIRQSLIATTDRIDTPTIQYDASNMDREKYDLYSTLFETIVLHRYTGQVEDSLLSMTRLLGSTNGLPSRITPAMTTTLLTAALDPLIQESVRKTIGRWYMDFVIQRRGDISGHIHFLFDGFLSWATDGSLFTSTLTATRTKTACAHGEALATVIARFAADTEDSPSFVPSNDFNTQEVGVDNRRGRAVLLGVVRFIMNARGRLFQPAILYMIHGLIAGLTARYENSSTEYKFESSDIAEILSLARLPGLPEVAGDLHSVHCRKLCELIQSDSASELLPAEEFLRARCKNLEGQVDQATVTPTPNDNSPPSLQLFLQNLRESKHSCIQGHAFAPACKALIKLLDQMDISSVDPDEVHTALAALWEEAEIRDFIRPFAVHLPPLMFHPTCINMCVAHHQKDGESTAIDLTTLLSKAMIRLARLSKGRSYVLATFARSLRKAAFTNPSIVSILPFEEYILDFVNDPASIKPEFLFEVVAAERLQRFLPHRTYTSYYGLREWHAYTAVVDILRRFPDGQLDVARSILNRLLQPWKDQQPPVAVKSPWKQTLQLQAILMLSHYCITVSDADTYLDGLTHALTLESWPRYRYLLEWTIARIHHQFPGKSSRIIDQLQDLDEYRPMHIASLIKLGLLVAPYEPEEFAARLMMELNAYSASPKVQIRHEANFAFPLVFDLATEKGWKSIIENPALVAMNAFIRRLDKFSASPWTIRTLRVNIEADFTIVGIFQGRYLSIESPEHEPFTCEDFEHIELGDKMAHVTCPPTRIQLGTAPEGQRTSDEPVTTPSQSAPTEDSTGQITLQTKAGIDLDNLHPASGPPSTQNQRPASVMLIASLIDNPTNLGGLSRISESFGLEALYIDDLKKVAHKDFKATSVRSEKHLAIKELKEIDVPTFLLEAKSQGYEVVGIEQTDRSGILGYEGVDGAYIGESGDTIEIVRHQDIGTLPKKCCLVLGSEKEGISAEVLAVIDRNVEIKTVGVTRSLNVQTAGGIALYEWWREWGI